MENKYRDFVIEYLKENKYVFRAYPTSLYIYAVDEKEINTLKESFNNHFGLDISEKASIEFAAPHLYGWMKGSTKWGVYFKLP